MCTNREKCVRTFRRRTVDELLPFGDRLAFEQGTMCQIGAHRRHLANTIKQSVLGDGDAALYLITIGTARKQTSKPPLW